MFVMHFLFAIILCAQIQCMLIISFSFFTICITVQPTKHWLSKKSFRFGKEMACHQIHFEISFL